MSETETPLGRIDLSGVRTFRRARRQMIVESANEETETRAGKGAGLARHCAVEPLTLKSGYHVHFAAIAK